MEIEKINLADKAEKLKNYWDPKIVGRVNTMMVKLARIKGEFEWHFHEDEDELFYVVEGELTMHFREKTQHLKPGEMIIIPHGVEHKPAAKDDCIIMLFEPNTTLNTGNVESELTKTDLEEI